LPQLNIKALHSLKTKSFGIILTPWAMFEPVSAFVLLFGFYGDLWRRMCSFWASFGVFANFFHNQKLFAQI